MNVPKLVSIRAVALGAAALISVFVSSAKADVDLWPLLERNDKETTVLYPFYVQDDTFTMVFPFYYGNTETHEHHILWPLIKFEDRRLARVTPIWFSEKEGQFFLFPLVWKDDSGVTTLIPPMSFGPHGELNALFPFFSRGTSPQGAGEVRDQLSVLWPLYSRDVVHSADGSLVSRTRRWLIFTDATDRSGKQTIRMLGMTISERVK